MCCGLIPHFSVISVSRDFIVDFRVFEHSHPSFQSLFLQLALFLYWFNMLLSKLATTIKAHLLSKAVACTGLPDEPIAYESWGKEFCNLLVHRSSLFHFS
jgi:hypothetical protein